MKKEQSLQHLIVTEMPYELLKLLIEEKSSKCFCKKILLKDTEVNSLVIPNYNKTRRIINLMTEFPHNIILGSFTWSKSEKGNDFWSNLFEKARLI